MDKTLSWFGNVLDKFDNFHLDIDDIINQDPFGYAENQLLTAGANVKQFCSEFAEEMLPESIINSLKKKSSPCVVEQLRTDVGERPKNAPSDDSSPFPMEIIESGYNDSPFETETNAGKNLCFEELHFRDIEVSQVKAYGLPQIPSSSRPSKVHELCEPVNRPSADAKVDDSTVTTLSSLLFPEVGGASDTAHADVKKEHSAVAIPDNSTDNPGCNGNLYSQHRGISSGHEVQSSNSNDISDVIKAKETEDNHDIKATEVIEDKCIMLDTRKLCLVTDLLEDSSISQETVCKSCSTMRFDKNCGCERITRANDENSESVPLGGKSQCQRLFEGESETAEQDICESDWVIV